MNATFTDTRSSPPLRFFFKLLGPLILGYLLFDKAFAYIRLPGTPLYLGELLLVIGFLGVAAAPWTLGDAVRREPILSVLLIFIAWGALRTLPLLSQYGNDAIRDAALWYYGFFGILTYVATWRPADRIRRYVVGFEKFLPWLLAWLPLGVVLIPFAPQAPSVPGSSISILTHKSGNAATAALLALVVLWSMPTLCTHRRRAILTVASFIVIALCGSQNRGGFLGVAVGAIVFFSLVRNGRRLAAKLGVILLVTLILVTVFPVTIPVKGSQGRDYSTEQLTANLLSLSGGPAEGNLEGTVEGRQLLWNRLMDKQLDDGRLADGFGFGPNLALSVGWLDQGTAATRNPHNSHLDVLSRMGLIGLSLWLALWVGWYKRMISACRRLAGQDLVIEHAVAACCVSVVTAILFSSFFDPQLEGPQVAVLIWSLFGLGVVVSSTARAGQDRFVVRADQMLGSTLRWRQAQDSEACFQSDNKISSAGHRPQDN